MSLLSFAYQPVKLLRKPPPWLPLDAKEKFRPQVRIRVRGQGQRVRGDAVLDTGADETTLPWDLADSLKVPLVPTGSVRTRGLSYPSGWGTVDFEFPPDGAARWTWRTRVRFSRAREYPLLGIDGFLQFMDATFFGKDRRVELRTNATFPERVTAAGAATITPPGGQQGVVTPNSLRFDYQEDPQQASRFLPLVAVKLSDLGGSEFMSIDQGVVDTGSEVCLFPLSYASQIPVQFLDNGPWPITWAGQKRPARYGKVQMVLADSASTWSWTAGVVFLDAPSDVQPRFPILGQAGFLEVMDATFLGARRELKLETNSSFRGNATRYAPP